MTRPRLPQLIVPLALLLTLSGRVAARDLVLAGGTLVDVSSFGNSTADIKDSVVVHEGKIAAAGLRREVKIPPGAQVIDIAGTYVVPGLTDSFSTLNNQAQANALLYMGVTSIVGLGEPPGGRRGPLYLEAKPSPRIYRLDWEWSPDATTSEAELIQKIDALAKSGVKALLLHYGMTPAQVRVTARRARELGMATIGEFGQTTYAEGIEAGVNAFVHTSRYSLDLAPPDLRKEVAEDPFGPPMVKFNQYMMQLLLDDPAVQRHAATLASGRVGLIPTQSMMYLDLPGHENPWKEPIAAILDPKDIHFPANPATGQREGGPPARPERATRFLELETQYRKAGAKFLAGSGADAFGTLPGIALHTELALLTRIGLTPRQALAAATGNVSELLGWSEVGQLKAGSNADLLLLDADPTQDVGNLKKIRMVLLNGEILDRERLLHPPAAAPAGPPPPSLYERIAARLARDPALAQRLESPPPELERMSWMLGSWDVTAHVFATATTPERVSQGQSEVRLSLGNHWYQITDTYPDGGMDEGFLTYNPATKQWTSVLVDVSGNAVISTARGWLDNRIVFLTPEIEILGEKATLQQTIERRGPTEYHVLNEEKLPDGRWVPLDEYTYRKRSEPAGQKD
jgi:hypothetical protein